MVQAERRRLVWLLFPEGLVAECIHVRRSGAVNQILDSLVTRSLLYLSNHALGSSSASWPSPIWHVAEGVERDTIGFEIFECV